MLLLLPEDDLLPVNRINKLNLLSSAATSDATSGDGATKGPAVSSSSGMPVGGMEPWDQSWGDSVTQRFGWRALVAEDWVRGRGAWGTKSEVSEPWGSRYAEEDQQML